MSGMLKSLGRKFGLFRNLADGDRRRIAGTAGAKFSSMPKSKRLAPYGDTALEVKAGLDAQEARIKLYRFLRDNLPALNASIWTWVKMASADLQFTVVDSHGNETASPIIRSEIDDFSSRIYENRFQKYGGAESLMSDFFNTLFTAGSVCGEVLLDAGCTQVDRFYFIDPATIRFRLSKDGEWEMFQFVEGEEVDLLQPTTYFYGLDADSVRPWGRSLLAAVPFAARVEQALVTDMNRSMHNAGYHRIHVKISPPEKLPSEDQEAYVSRANSYFDDTVNMVRGFEPDDNPITWDDVQIDYIGPSSKISSSSSWYLNHKAILEDICVGTHLAPFMLGYSHGATHSWAEFNFELLQRQLRSIQSAAVSFLNWLTEIELSLKGINAKCVWRFENPISVGLLDRRKAESIEIDNVIKKLDAGLIDIDVAREALDCAQ